MALAAQALLEEQLAAEHKREGRIGQIVAEKNVEREPPFVDYRQYYVHGNSRDILVLQRFGIQKGHILPEETSAVAPVVTVIVENYKNTEGCRNHIPEVGLNGKAEIDTWQQRLQLLYALVIHVARLVGQPAGVDYIVEHERVRSIGAVGQ
jgi:hypothetical protein